MEFLCGMQNKQVKWHINIQYILHVYLRISAVDWTYPLDAKLTYCLLSVSVCLTALRPI